MLPAPLPLAVSTRPEGPRDVAWPDPPPEMDHEGLTQMLRQALGAPIALVAPFDGERHWVRPTPGLQAAQTAVAAGLCDRAVASGQPLLLADTLADPCLADGAPALGEPQLRFYAGVPVLVDGLPVGTVCVIDQRPRDDGPRALELLRAAALVAAAAGRLQRRLGLAESGRRDAVRAFVGHADWTWHSDHEGLILSVSARQDRLPALAERVLVGQRWTDLMAHAPRPTRERLARALRDGRGFQMLSVDWPVAARPDRRLWISGVPVHDAEGVLRGFHGIAQDPDRPLRMRRRAEQAESLMQEAIDVFDGPVMLADRDGHVLAFNRLWQQLHPAGRTGTGWAQAVCASPGIADAPALVAALSAAGQAEWAAGGRWWLTRAYRVQDGRVLQVGIDISAAHQAAQASRQHAAIHRAVAEVSPDGVVVLGADGVVRSHNAAAARLWRMPARRLTGTQLFALPVQRIDDQGRPLPPEAHPLRLAIARREAVRGTRMGVVRGGAPVQWFEIDVLPLDGATEAVYVFRDVTDLRAVQAVRQAFGAASDGPAASPPGAEGVEGGLGVWQWDLQRSQLYLSREWLALLGLPPSQDGDNTRLWRRHAHPADRRQVLRALRDAVREGRQALSFEIRLRHQRGGWRWMAARGRLQRSADGRPLELVGVMTDITAHHHAQQALAQRSLAEAESRSKSQFLSRVSHELRTPLNAVVGFARLLQGRRPALPQQAAEQVGRIHDAGRHLLGLVNDLMDMQRIETDALPLSMEVLDLGELTASVVDMCSSLAQEHGVTVRVDRALDGLRAQADVQRTRQILLNLVSNGIKYNRDGGELRIGAVLEGARLVLHVADQGAGLDAQALARLFQPFERLGRERNGVPGTGLGLVISRRLAEAMGGELRVSSRPGRGSDFQLALPRAAAAASATRDLPGVPTAAAAPAPIAHRSLVYVEDNPVNALLMEAVVARAGGWTLELARSCEEALALVDRVQPSVMLVDAQLPDGHGVDLLAQLRRRHAWVQQIPVVMLTADAMPEDRRRSLEAGFLAHWTKPIDIDAVIGHLRSDFAALRRNGG